MSIEDDEKLMTDDIDFTRGELCFFTAATSRVPLVSVLVSSFLQAMTSIVYEMRKIIVVAFIAFRWASAMQFSDYIRLISEVRDNSATSSVFLLYDSLYGLKESKELCESIRLLSMKGGRSVSMDFESVDSNVEFYMTQIRRPLFVVFLNSEDRVAAFAKFTRNFTMAYPVWLLIFDTNVGPKKSSSLHSEIDFHLTFDTEMLVFRTNSRIIEEWYSIREERRRIAVATWDVDFGYIPLSNKTLYQRRNNLENSTVVMALNYKPMNYIDAKYLTSTVFTHVFMEVCRSLNISVKSVILTIRPRDTIIGMLERKEVDLTVLEFAMTSSRMLKMDFTYPMSVTSGQLYIRQPETGIRWSGYSNIFSPKIWNWIAISILLATILLTFAIVVKGDGLWYCSFVEQSSLVLGVYCLQGLPEFPTSMPLRVAYTSIYIAAFVIFAEYSASLTSFLAVTDPELPFTSLEDFLETGTHKLIIRPETSEYYRFANATSPILLKVFSRMKPDAELPRSLSNIVKQICTERVAFYVEQRFLPTIKEYSPCDMVAIDAKMTTNFAIATSKRHPFYGVINYYIKQFRYSGICDRLFRSYSPQVNSEAADYYEVNFMAITPILTCLFAGIILAVIFLCLEQIYSQKRWLAARMNKMFAFFPRIEFKRQHSAKQNQRLNC